MTSTGLLANVRHVFAVQRAQRHILRRARESTARRRWRRNLDQLGALAFPLLLPAFLMFAAWRDAASERTTMGRPWAIAAVLAVLMHSGHGFQARTLVFTAREVLRLPDKSSVLAVRLLCALPFLLLRGLVWAAACALHSWPLGSGHSTTIVLCTAMAFVAPLAWNVGELLRRLIAPASESRLLASAAVVAALVYAANPQHWGSGSASRSIELWVMLAIGAVGTAALAQAWWRQPRDQLRALWPELVRLPRFAVIVVLLLANADTQTATVLRWVAGIAAATEVALLPFAAFHLLRAVRFAEASTGGAAITRASEHDPDPERRSPRERAAPARPHRGRSPLRAAWRLHWIEYGGGRSAPLARRLLYSPLELAVFTLRHAPGALLLLPVLLSTDPRYEGMVVAAGLFTPALIDDGHKLRRYQFGVDLREQARLHTLAVLLFAALPMLTIATAGAMATSTPRPWVPLALAATFAWRIGWRGFTKRGELARPSGWPLLVVAILIAAIWLPIVHWWTVAPTLALGVAGCVLRVRRWREPELAAAFVAAREAEERGLVTS